MCRRRTDHYQESDAQPQFVPAINARSERLVEDSPQVPSDFLARQRLFQQRQQHRLLQLVRQAVHFQPLLSLCQLTEQDCLAHDRFWC